MAGRALRPLALIATAVVLVAFALGSWVPVDWITEPARRSTAAPKPATDPGRAQAEKAGIDVDAVVDKVRHRVTPAEDGSLAADDEQYRAHFDAEGFGFTLDDHSSSFGVSLRGVQRGADALALELGAWRGEANVAMRAIGAGMTERVTARAGELEWDVVLDRPLPGSGDLRIEADVRGLDGVATRAGDHWRFPLPDGQTARMGEVVVKAATGSELHRALPQLSGDELRLVIPASVLAEARYPLTIDPTVGPEQSVGDPLSGAAGGTQSLPALAWNGTDFLVVWTDARSDFGDIFGARVDGAGSVLDPAGIPISTAANSQVDPAVAWNGANFLVAWTDRRAGGSVADDIYVARVTAAGSVLDPNAIPVVTAVGFQSRPAVAWNGTDFLVVWHDTRSGTSTDIFGSRVSAAGVVLDPAGIPISSAANSQIEVAVAQNGTDFLVVWADNRAGVANYDIYGARVSGAGVVLDPAGIPISLATDNQRAPAVAKSGGSYLVAWQDRRSGTDWDIYGSRVGPAGSVAEPAGIALSTATNDQTAPALAWTGTTYLLVWQDFRSGTSNDSYGTRVSSAGVVSDPAGIPISTATGSQTAPAVTGTGTAFFVVWAGGSGDGDINGARVSSAGEVLDPVGVLLSTGANSQGAPAVAWNGTDFLVVWTDSRSSCQLCGARVSGDGTVLDPAGIQITANGFTPEVAWNGTDFLVVWYSGAGIFGARLSSGGTVLDPAGITISTAPAFQHEPAVASDGTNFFVVWTDWRNDFDDDNPDIFGARISPAGTVLDPAGIQIASICCYQQSPAVAWNGRTFQVVWVEVVNGDEIYGARVSAAGTVLDGGPGGGFPISTAANQQVSPAVASWGENFLVVWADRRSGTSYDIYGTGVGADGTVAHPAGIPISTSPGDQTAPDLAVRYHYLVAWQDRRSGANRDIYATRMSPNGTVQEPNGVLVAGAATEELAPAVIGGPGATWGVAYQRFAPEAPYGAHRAFLRHVSPK